MHKYIANGVASVAVFAFLIVANPIESGPAFAQEAAEAATAPEPLGAEEMEVLVARIALYPDELVAAIVAASLYPLQIVQAQRYLGQVKKEPDLKPDKDWDGSVISLLNYPEIVAMMGDDLDWTEALGEAVSNQEKDLLEAIQQLRDKAVAQGVLKSDEKTTVVQENDRVIIQPAVANEIYVPVYEAQMLYEPEYVPAPITYYPEPYPSYYYPTAPYFAGVVTGAIWAAAIDWNDWGVWGGNGRWGNDIDIDCNNCFNNRDFNGKVNWNDVDWNNVDRSKMSFDKSQFNKINSNDLRQGLQANDRNNLKSKAGNAKRNQPSFGQKGNRQTKDVRKSTLDGLKKQSTGKAAKAGDRAAKSGQVGNKAAKPSQGAKINKSAKGSSAKMAKRPSGKAKPAARADTRSKKPSPMGDINRGRDAKSYSNRGGKSMGGGMNRGGGAQQFKRRPSGGGGGGRRGGGGGGRGGRR